MQTIPHQKAQKLLQLAADTDLEPNQRQLLDDHLASCPDCQSYAHQVDELQGSLRRVMRRQWDVSYTPVPLQSVKDRTRMAVLQNKISATIGRFAVLPVLALAFVVTVKMAAPQPLAANLVSPGTPGLSFHTPTPPSHLTATRLLTQDCPRITYAVGENDTLDNIAARYDVDRETIMAYNGLASAQLSPNSVLVIPLCNQTPADTKLTPTVTITLVPLNVDTNPSPTG